MFVDFKMNFSSGATVELDINGNNCIGYICDFSIVEMFEYRF